MTSSFHEITHRRLTVGNVEIFYRESHPKDVASPSPAILLLHGFPSTSHQYRGLMERLGGSFRMIAPDYPGFGQSTAPVSKTDGGTFEYTFDSLSHSVEAFIDTLGLTRVILYIFDFGAPVGMRIANRRPELIAGLIIQNGNCYDAGLSAAARRLMSPRSDDPAVTAELAGLLTPEGVRFQYVTGASRPGRIAPDNYDLDFHYIEQPGRKQPQLDLLLDYKSNLPLYPQWQEWLRTNLPPALIVWGKNDPFFTAAGAQAYLDDLPNAHLQLLDTGHFALEECLPQIASLIAHFVAGLSSK
ncbi:alpha/beta hydrolase [Rhizobium laguerreae]|uniref:alpha/beta fold hydrolase n=1 Tax=Rhizobium laguerreae TaxID=1076926 RepID=UPI001D659B7F|nr:alpha/beta hydrolase [Rhizobium laguerreae]MBY3297802.1 alpha/beta hydrolase [Rhizobium laguerreae]MBY3310900.1 alpha/beta hydrolase [Rhizobium laguerreae]MBY3324022.1 alpha/beta hydrolase [Rhizobium laguerreae]MBY3540124.1 alpha/beta hydrolase [Rhizobium laguerreae]MBY3547740.1 alpha/beta hydrolase [Rhizobium laguerreae]